MNLRTRVIKATAWFFAARLAAKILAWGVTIMLARMLTPADYGLFSMSLAAIAFFELFQEFGLGTAIIQRQRVSREQLNAFFWIVFGSSVVLAAVTLAAAGPIAAFYREPRLIGMVRILSLTFVIGCIGMVPYNLLTKEIDFRRRSMAEVSGTLAAAVTAIALAWQGYGVWALIAGHLASAITRNAVMVMVSGWRPGFAVSFRGIGEVMSFSLQVTGTTVVKTLSDVAAVTIVGRLLGGHALGLYTMADSFGRNPLHKLSTSLINQMSLPVFAKLQREDAQLRSYFLRASRYLAAISIPTHLGIALVAADLVVVVLSDKWAPMVGLVQAFCVGSLCYVLSAPGRALLTARGRSDKVFAVYLGGAVVLTVGLLLGSQFGLGGVAGAWLVAVPPLRLYLLWLSLRETGLTITTYLETISSALLATVMMMMAVLLVRLSIPASMGAPERLVIEVVAGTATYLPVLLWRDRRFGGEVKTIVQTLFATSRA